MVILDSDIIIDHLRQPKNTLSIYSRLVKSYAPNQIFISTISIQELFQGNSSLNATKLKDIVSFLNQHPHLPYTKPIAKLAGEINRDLTIPIGFADAAIAATAIVNDCHLLTLNTKHFAKIPHLKLLLVPLPPTSQTSPAVTADSTAIARAPISTTT